MTDRERIDAYLATIPGDDAAAWQKIATSGCDLVAGGALHSDDTVDWQTWGHLRNIVDALRQLAFVLGAAERGDDPDIPF